MNYEIKSWFGENIGVIKLDTKSFNHEIKKIILKDVEPNPGRHAKTTDIEKDKNIIDNLHNDKRFIELFKQVREGLFKYLQEIEYRSDVFDVYYTKAWATLTTQNQLITPHRHTASNLSLVYYVQAEDQGNLTFHKKKDGLYVPSSTDYYVNENIYNRDMITYPSETGNLIIFPSNLEHYTELNTKNHPRISIGIDVVLTMKEGFTSEHNLSSPTTWRKL